jgi:hypothetical protein
MIVVNGNEIKLEGSFGDLIKEVARAMHAIAKAVAKEIDSEDITYDDVIIQMLSDLATYKHFDTKNSVVPQEIELKFMKDLEKYRKEKGHSPSWVEYHSGNPFISKKKNPIQESLKDFIIDPRLKEEFNLDEFEKDLEKPKKKKKKK